MVFSWWRTTAPNDTHEPIAAKDAKIEERKIEDGDIEDNGLPTPKAEPQTNGVVVPSFTLQDFPSDSSDEEDDMPPPQFPALNSAQRASGTRKPPVPSFVMPSAKPSLSAPMMAPPPRPTPSGGLQPPRLGPVPSSMSSTSGLRVPASGPLPNRGQSNPSSSLSVQLTTSVTQPNPRKKIALSPGHSPLDWANLQKTHPNLSGVPGFQRVTPSMLKFHNGRKGRPAWSSYQGRVYNITPYLPFHPGGEGELRRCAGKDGEKLFMEVHPWVNWDNMMEQCMVGILVSENDPRAGKGSPLDDMD
jgi:cytochrome b involved in lipid metabolism